MMTEKKMKSNTNTGSTPDSISSAPMENSIPLKDIVAFGRQLVEELGLEPSVDTLGRWMAHYLAEVMAKAEKAQGSKKAAAEREVFELILRFWNHRSSMPGRRPLQSFTPIFRTLEALQESTHLWYFETHRAEPEGEAGEWLKLASHVDHAARAIIRWCIAMASKEAAQEEKKWLEADMPKEFEDADDLHAAKLLRQDVTLLIGTEEKNAEQKNELADIRKRLDALVKLSRQMCDMIDGVLGEPKVKSRVNKKHKKKGT